MKFLYFSKSSRTLQDAFRSSLLFNNTKRYISLNKQRIRRKHGHARIIPRNNLPRTTCNNRNYIKYQELYLEVQLLVLIVKPKVPEYRRGSFTTGTYNSAQRAKPLLLAIRPHQIPTAWVFARNIEFCPYRSRWRILYL